MVPKAGEPLAQQRIKRHHGKADDADQPLAEVPTRRSK
jgi:hypothetical protein